MEHSVVRKIGIIGYGHIAKKHEKAIAAIESCELVAIYDINAPSNVAFSVFDNIDVFLAQDLDIVVVCTPNGLHAIHASQALLAGHTVICEKPLALNSQGCTQIMAASKASGQSVFCTMQNRYSPVSQWLKQLAKAKSLGDIYLLNVSCYWNRNKNYYEQAPWRGNSTQDGGPLFTQFSHYIDTLYWLFGSMTVHNAQFNNFDHGALIDFEDTGIFNFTFDNGGIGTFSYTTSCYEKNFESSMAIIGSKGTVKVAGQYMDRVTYCNIDNITTPDLPSNDNMANILSVYQNVFNHLEGKSSEMTTAEDGKEVVKIIEEVYAFREKL